MNIESDHKSVGEMTEKVEEKTSFEVSDLSKRIALQKEVNGESVALFSDFDGTLFTGDIKRTYDLVNEAHLQGVPVTVVTGRGAEGLIEMVTGLVETYNHEHADDPIDGVAFDAIIGAVGTEIYYPHRTENGISLSQDKEYEASLIEHGYRRSEIAAKVADMLISFSRDYPELNLSYQPEFINQEKVYLSGDNDAEVQPMKVSLNFNAEDMEEMNLVKEKFEVEFPELRIVISEAVVYTGQGGGIQRKRYCLDILPVTKAEAVDYLVQKANISRGLVAGDSGNDISMLADSSRLDAVLVGGHKKEAAEAIMNRVLDDPERRARRAQTIVGGSGEKRVYIGDDDKKGPESLRHAAEVYERARKIKEIREQINRQP